MVEARRVGQGYLAGLGLPARYPVPAAMRAACRRRLLGVLEPRAPRRGARLVDELLGALAAQTVTVAAEATLGRVIADLQHNAAILRLARRRCNLIHRILSTGLTYGELPAGKTGTPNTELLLTNP